MQNRFFGDIGDFGKFGLLRHLVAGDSLRLGVNWYLTPDSAADKNGQFLEYLDQAQPTLRNCDPELFDGLRRSISDGRRNVGEVERNELLPKGTVYFSQPLAFPAGLIPKRRQELRRDWLEASLDATSACDLVFLDPDNGLEPKAGSRYSNSGTKFVYFDDVLPLVERGQSVVIYHHLDRSASAELQARNRARQIQEQLGTEQPFAVMFRRKSARFYFVVPGAQLTDHLSSRIDSFVRGPWSAHFSRML